MNEVEEFAMSPVKKTEPHGNHDVFPTPVICRHQNVQYLIKVGTSANSINLHRNVLTSIQV